jgi:hypothetical protein
MSAFFSAHRPIVALSDSNIMKQAPAVFAGAPKATTSERYLFVDTSDILNGLRENGWSCVSASQVLNRGTTEANRLSNKHALFFARTDSLSRELGLKETIPLLKVENSHNGLSTFGLSTGFFRKVCSNGLTVSEELYQAPKIKHVKNMRDEVIEATYRVLQDFPMLMSVTEKMQSVALNEEEKLLLADSVAHVLYSPEDRERMQQFARSARSGERALIERQLLATRRFDDRKNDLWTVSNVIQENIIRGNIQTLDSSGKLRFQRAVSSIDRDREIHDVLFKISAHFAKEKGVNIAAVA